MTEIQVVWRVAEKLKARLERAGYQVVLTKKNEEQFVANRKRAQVANRFHARLMLRLHCDAQGGTGFAVYYPDRQGVSAGKRGPSTSVIQQSAEAARVFHQRFAFALRGRLQDNGLKPDTKTAVGAKQGALTGSIFSQVPVVLVEMVVLTNPSDERYITSSAGQQAVVDALFEGVRAVVPLPYKAN